MKNKGLTDAEKAGKDYFLDHPSATHAMVKKVARKEYSIVLRQELFIAGWNQAFWDEQERVLKASRKAKS